MFSSTRNLFNDPSKIRTDFLDVLESDPEAFLSEFLEFLKHYDVWMIFHKITDSQKDKINELCHKNNVFLVHKLIANATKVEYLKFLQNDLYKSNLYRHNLESKTWLQIAVLNNRNINIIKFLVEVLEINPSDKDIYGYTILHSLCQKDMFNEEEFQYLLEKVNLDNNLSNWLMIKAEDGVTPLELACCDENKLNFIKKNKEMYIINSLINIDNISVGLPGTLDDSKITFINLPKDKMWLTILQNNDKQRLIKYIQLQNFLTNVYLDNKTIEEILRKLPDNGLGILRFVKKEFLSPHQNEDIKGKTIFEKVSGIKNFDIKNDHCYSNCIIFICLISGRYELIPLLLRSCQFQIVPYAIMTCYLCQILNNLKELSNQAKINLNKVKLFCETFAIESISRTENKETKNQKKIMISYLNSPMNCLDNYSIIELAYKAECNLFMNLRLCQTSLDQMWYGRLEKLTDSENFYNAMSLLKLTLMSPYFKFYLHSALHLVFLFMFSWSLVDNNGIYISSSLIFCWIYAGCYMIEEIRQFYLSYYSGNIAHYFTDETNVVDISALFLIIGGTLLMLINGYENSNKENRMVFWVIFIYGLSLILFFMRLLYMAYVFEIFGQKLKMIGKMILKDLGPLLYIFGIFIASFGILFQALIRFAKRNNWYGIRQAPFKFSSDLGNIIRRPTFSIFNAHYILDEIESVFFENPNELAVVYFLLITFCVVVNIMLMNLLIALFSQTVAEIATDSQMKWRANRYKIIKEYYERTYAPPPINIIFVLVEIFNIYKKSNGKKETPKEKKVCIQVEEPLNTPTNTERPIRHSATFVKKEKNNEAEAVNFLQPSKAQRSLSNMDNKDEIGLSVAAKLKRTFTTVGNKFKTLRRDDLVDDAYVELFSNNILSHFSFYVLQAFAMRDCRYMIATSDEERQIQLSYDMTLLLDRVNKIEKAVYDLNQHFD